MHFFPNLFPFPPATVPPVEFIQSGVTHSLQVNYLVFKSLLIISVSVDITRNLDMTMELPLV